MGSIWAQYGINSTVYSTQGSVLGPLFFLIYVNDMVRVSKDLGFVLFADDTNIFAEGRDPVELFGRVNGALGHWGSSTDGSGAIDLL